MTKTIVFYIRNKPQDADIIELNLNLKRVFVGYPPFKKGVPFNEKQIKSCIYDISVDSFSKEDIINPDFYKKGISNQIKLVKEAVPGSFVIIPRPGKAGYYIGKISRFELVDNPQ